MERHTIVRINNKYEKSGQNKEMKKFEKIIYLPDELWMHIKTFVFIPNHRYYLNKIIKPLDILFNDIELFHTEIVNYYNTAEMFLWEHWSFPKKLKFLKEYRKHFNEQLCGDTLIYK